MHLARASGGERIRVIRGPRYVVVTPARDEAAFARRTLDSVLAQTLPPSLWVVVDDGSRDGTPKILAEAARRCSFLRIVRREDRGRRSVGPGVVDAFYAGYATIRPRDFDYVCKMDLDLELPRRYFERTIERMEAEPRLGTWSGKPYYVDGRGRLVPEGCGDDVSVGMIKLYRRRAFEEIGGFVRQVMWDGIDCHRCRMLGWEAGSSDDPETRFLHLRPMGSSEGNWLEGRARHGRGQYFMGTSPLYMAASALRWMARPPRVAGGLSMLWGYLASAWSGARRYEDPAFHRFLRRYQWLVLLHGKKGAIERLRSTVPASRPWVGAPAISGSRLGLRSS